MPFISVLLEYRPLLIPSVAIIANVLTWYNNYVKLIFIL